MRRPNFFILGAPKCGTSSMAAWLSQHPNVFGSPVKEPFFFCTDIIPNHPRDSEEYEQLFAEATSQHRVVFEATTSYLYSKVALDEILEYSTSASFLVMIRSPVEMAYALHAEMLYQGDEHIRDFGRAWSLQPERRHGQLITPLCRDPQLLLYGPYCKLGAQIERLYERAPRHRVCVIVLDDVKEDPDREYRKVLKFLRLPPDGRSEFPVHNEAKVRRFPRLARLARPIEDIRRKLGPTYRGFGLLTRASEWNRIAHQRPPLSSEMREELSDYFREDVRRLSHALNRDLTYWVT